jgi:hypothetical protein
MNDDPLPDPGARVLWLAAALTGREGPHQLRGDSGVSNRLLEPTSDLSGALTSREGPHQLSGDSGVSNRLREPTSDLSGALTSREGPHQLSGDSGVSNRLLEPTSDLSGALTSREGPRQLSGDSGALCIARELSFNADVPHARSHRASRSKAALIGSLVCVLLAMALTAVIAIGQLTLSDSRGQLAIDRMVELASSSARPAPARSATQPALHIEWVPAVSPAPAQPQLDREESTAAPPVSPVLAQRQIDREEITVLINRGKDLIANGDLAAARLVLQRAADANDAEAALALAATYDPVVLRELKVYGFTADAAMARAWYQRARELGSAAALKRLEILITGAR